MTNRLDTGVADPWTDLGPERTNLVDQTTYIEEDPSARSAIAAITLRTWATGSAPI